MPLLNVDLHNHSCLSPCGDLDMSPRAMVQQAKSLGIDILGLTDHNSALNCPAFASACRDAGICGVFGLEITTMEEVHVLALFEEVDQALNLGKLVEGNYEGFPNIPDKMGDQVFVDEEENILGEVRINLAQGATMLGLEQWEQEIHKRNGLFIPAHVDRPAFSLISQLGFIPEGHYDALEWFHMGSEQNLNYPAISGSDAHYLQDMGKRSISVDCSGKSFQELKAGLKKL